jgi:hypothetical protein
MQVLIMWNIGDGFRKCRKSMRGFLAAVGIASCLECAADPKSRTGSAMTAVCLLTRSMTGFLEDVSAASCWKRADDRKNRGGSAIMAVSLSISKRRVMWIMHKPTAHCGADRAALDNKMHKNRKELKA